MTQVPLAPPPPGQDPITGKWLYLLWRRLTQAGQILWGSLDFTGSNLTDLATRNHNDLQNIAGGSSNDYSHLTSAQLTDLTDAGDSTLHYHATDRELGNATGTLAIGNGGTGQTTATAAFDALAPTTTQGDLIYHNGTDNVRLAKGTAAQVLTMNAGATAPEWADASGSGVTQNVISAATTIDADTSYIVLSYLTVTDVFTVNGNLGVI